MTLNARAENHNNYERGKATIPKSFGAPSALETTLTFPARRSHIPDGVSRATRRTFSTIGYICTLRPAKRARNVIAASTCAVCVPRGTNMAAFRRTRARDIVLRGSLRRERRNIILVLPGLLARA